MKILSAYSMKILFVSLGCDKNLVDSEEMLGTLRAKGFDFTDDEAQADAAVVNTCCFIMDAQKESIDHILALAERRTEGSLKALIVTGCMAQRYKDEVLKEIPEVDAVIGTTEESKIAEVLAGILEGEAPADGAGRLLIGDENARTGQRRRESLRLAAITATSRSRMAATSTAHTA